MIDPKGRSLLIVDDDRVQRMVFKSVGNSLGFEVLEASTVDEARSVVEGRSIDFVILDLSLGDRDGVDVILDLSERDQRPSILVVSGHDDRIRDAALRFCRAVRIKTLGELQKPIDLARLRTMLLQGAVDAGSAPRAPDVPLTADMIAQALKNGEIYAAYQPKICLRTNAVTGAEALARWTKDGRSIPPDRFCRAAEAFGLGTELTIHMLRSACAAASFWNRTSKISVAVNTPPSVLCNPSFPSEVDAILEETGLDPNLLVIEVVESGPALEQQLIAGVLTRLRLRGIGISIDDFGTGFSSLDSLLNLPFTELKIDARFFRDCDRDPYALKIVKASLGLASEFGISSVAEGIETANVARTLEKLGCNCGQGWLYSPAVTPEKFLETVLSDVKSFQIGSNAA